MCCLLHGSKNWPKKNLRRVTITSNWWDVETSIVDRHRLDADPDQDQDPDSTKWHDDNLELPKFFLLSFPAGRPAGRTGLHCFYLSLQRHRRHYFKYFRLWRIVFSCVNIFTRSMCLANCGASEAVYPCNVVEKIHEYLRSKMSQYL